MPGPRKFFEEFVRRSYEDFRASPSDEYLAKMAVANANDMAERMLHAFAGTPRVFRLCVGQETKYREKLAQDCEAFGIVRDVAEGHKHFRLTRRPESRRVSSSEQTGTRPIQFVNNAREPINFVNNAGQKLTFVTNVIVELDDGTTRPLLPLVEEVVAMWNRLSR